jgi:hypothetical protein
MALQQADGDEGPTAYFEHTREDASGSLVLASMSYRRKIVTPMLKRLGDWRVLEARR